jgi:hypothetical protein
LNNSSILPTSSSVSQKTIDHVLATLRALQRRHDPHRHHYPLLAREADQVVVLDRGHIASGMEGRSGADFRPTHASALIRVRKRGPEWHCHRAGSFGFLAGGRRLARCLRRS